MPRLSDDVLDKGRSLALYGYAAFLTDSCQNTGDKSRAEGQIKGDNVLYKLNHFLLVTHPSVR